LLACLIVGVEHVVVDELGHAVGEVGGGVAAAAAAVLPVQEAPALTLSALPGLALF
jgi:hypothetical protein